VDPEDLDIFKVVDDPAEAVRLVRMGMKKHWWKPLDAELNRVTGNGENHTRPPLAGSKAASTGEGTRYGRRPKRSNKKHVKASRKPQQ
jgi:hypothetical protein